mgnify:CR=1 FL=1
MDIRFALPEDNDRLLKIERESAQEGNIWVVAYRENFFDRLKYFKDGFIMIAEEDGDIIGCIGVAFDDYYFNSRIMRGIYLFGLRTNPRYRMKIARWLKEVIGELERMLGPSDYGFAYAAVKADNIASIKILKHMGFEYLSTLNFYACPVLRKLGNRSIEIDNRPRLENVFQFYESLKGDLDLAPENMNLFRPMIEENRIKIFKSYGAQALVLDTSGEHDFGITRLSPGLRAFQIVGRGLLSPFVRIPKMNSKLRTWDVLMLEYEDLKEARKVVSSIHKEAYKDGVTLLNFAQDESLGSLKPVVGKLSFKIPFELMITEKERQDREKRPVLWLPTL